MVRSIAVWVSLRWFAGVKKDVKNKMEINEIIGAIDNAIHAVASLPVTKKNNAALRKLIAVKAEYVSVAARDEILSGVPSGKKRSDVL